MSPWKLRSIALPTELLMPAANTVTNDDQRQPDHQRGRGDGGAARLAHRVLARQAAGDAAQPLERPAGHRRQRAHEPRAEQRHAEQDRHRAAAHQAGRGVGVSMPAEQPEQVIAIPTDGEQRARSTAKTRPRVRPSGSSASRSAAIGETRVARSAGHQRRDERHDHAHHERDDDRARWRSRCRCWAGRSRSVLNSALMPAREADPAEHAEHGAEQADDRAPRASPTRSIWPRDAPSVRSIPNSRIRWATVIEKVLKIRKLPTNSATPREHEQRRSGRSSGRRLMSCAWRCGGLRAGLHLRRRGSTWAIALRSSPANPVGGLHGDLVELALLLGQALRLGQGELGRCSEPPDDVSPSFAEADDPVAP